MTAHIKSSARLDFIVAAEARACTPDYCFICGRCTDHFGEHSKAQIIACAAPRPSTAPRFLP